MKLELKHLTAYLPYDFKVILSGIGRFNLDLEYPDNRYNDEFTISDILISGEEIEIHSINYDISVGLIGLEEIKPILRPLSDLNRDIEIDGKIFNPFEKMYYGLMPEVAKKQKLEDLQKRPMLMPYYSIVKLLEWHFDIFGLIENGLAVEYDKLNKHYGKGIERKGS